METEKKVLPGVFTLIKQSLTLYKKNFKILVMIGLVPVAYSIIQLIISTVVGKANPILLIIVSVILGIVGFVIQMTYQISLMKAVSDVDQGKIFTTKSIYKEGLGLFFPFIWLAIITVLCIVGSSILLIIPGIIFAVYSAFCSYTLIIDGKKGMSSISASIYYVKGNWWKVFGRLLAIVVIIIAIMIVIGIIFSIIAVIIFKSSNPVSVQSFLTGIQSYSTGITILGIVLSIVSGLISSCVAYPIIFGYQYLIYKNLKLLKLEPNPEVDFKKSRKLLKALSIFGLIVCIALIIIPFSFGIVSGFKNASLRANSLGQFPQSQTTAQSKFPTTATTLPINLASLESKAYINKDLGIAINLPKKWQAEATAEGIYIAKDLKNPVDSDIIIEKKELPAQVSNITTDVLMGQVSKSVLAVASSSLTNIEFKKYNISSMDAYVITGMLNTGNQIINENYYFIRNGSDVFTITAEAGSTALPTVLPMIIDSINTLKITK